MFPDQSNDMFQEKHASRASVFLVRVREVFPDIPQGQASQQRIHDGMGQNIGVGMAQKSHRMRDFHTSEDQFPALSPTVYIISYSDSIRDIHFRSPCSKDVSPVVV